MHTRGIAMAGKKCLFTLLSLLFTQFAVCGGEPPLKLVHIAPMFEKNQDEIAADITDMGKKGIINEVAFSMKLNPDGTPPRDLLTPYIRRFQSIQQKIAAQSEVRCGILLQASIGHGYIFDNPPANFARITPPSHLAKKSVNSKYMSCPVTPEFQEYWLGVMRKLAALKPAFLIVDDDFRPWGGRYGCLCKQHIDLYNQQKKTSFDYTTLSLALQNDRKTALDYENFVADTFIDLLKKMRAVLDETAPEIEMYYCSSMLEIKHAPKFAKACAGKNHPAVARLGNGRYARETMRDFPSRMYTTATIISVFRNGGVDKILSEADTCPQNQYSTSAALLNCHMAGSIAEGTDGAKHWLSRGAAECFEPASGKAYRDILAEYTPFYLELQRLQKIKKDIGICSIVPSSDWDYSIYQGEAINNQTLFTDVIGRLGLPCNFSDKPALPSVIVSEYINALSDEKISALLKNGIIVDGAAAEILTKRGFAQALGVKAEFKGDSRRLSERTADGKLIASQPINTRRHLTVTDPGAEIISTFFDDNGDAVSPAMVRTGKSLIFAGTVYGGQWLGEFSFFNETRKKLIFDAIEKIADLPVQYRGTGEVFTKLWLADGYVVMPLITLGRDDLKSLELKCKKVPVSVESLSPGGKWLKVPFSAVDSKNISVNQEFRATRPFVLRFRF